MMDKIRTFGQFQFLSESLNHSEELNYLTIRVISSNVLLSCGSHVRVVPRSPKSLLNSLTYNNTEYLLRCSHLRSVRIRPFQFKVCRTKSGQFRFCISISKFISTLISKEKPGGLWTAEVSG